MRAPNDGISQKAVEDFLNDLIFQLYAGARNSVPPASIGATVVSDAASIDQILGDPARFPKNLGLVAALGDSRFNLNGAAWETRRDITQKHYAAAGSARNASSVHAVYHERLGTCDATFEDIQRALMLSASEVFFRALDCATDVQPLQILFERARPHLKRVQYYSWKMPGASELAALQDETRDILAEFESEIASSPALTQLIASFQARGGSDAEFDPLEELLMNFLAGIETTAATLSFALDRLGLDPRVQRRLLNEIEAGREETYLDCVIQETLRYFPAIPFVVRQAASDTTLGEVFLAKGRPFIVSIVGLHHDQRYWNEPDIFDCSRSEFINASYNRLAFLPFLSGPRVCGGAKLARLELREGLKALVRHFTVESESDRIGFDYGLALRPLPSGNINIARRRA